MFGLFKSRNDRLLKSYYKILEIVNQKEDNLKALTDEALKNEFENTKKSLQVITKGFVVDKKNANYINLLALTFAIVREASSRTLKMRHFDVQIIGGLILNDGKIAEMKTGEGKTLVATLPAVFNAACKIPVHVITVNDYLCQRDHQNLLPLYSFLGLSVGIVNSSTELSKKNDEYLKDIVYATNNEIGFDYLRDNMRDSLTAFLQKGLGYAVVDEIDSILIDEARTPLIISGPLDIPIEIYKICDKIAKQITNEMIDIDEKTRQIHLKDEAYDKIEVLLKQYGVTKQGEFVYGSQFTASSESEIINTHKSAMDADFYTRASKIMNCMEQALKANKIFKDNVDYILKGQKVQIVDEFTGRIMEGRRYSDGLHQAIEAKHGVPILQESQTLASTSYQNLFRLYYRLSGMTGTAKTEEDEFINIYGLDVIAIPTNKPLVRKDHDDLVYGSQEEKFEAIANFVKNLYDKGQPVLVGTVSIDKSEKLSAYFKNKGIIHNVLNAKHHAKEAEIISQAGQLKAVTIATNMAGRGTDIILGGNVEHKISQLLANKKQAEADKIIEEQKANNAKVKELGGLFILGSERHESRRIDNQLRGRSGRQGDVGASQFYLSLEDDLLRIFGGERIKAILSKVGFKKGEVINHGFLNTIIKKAQEKVENYNFDIRKNLLKYDDVINEQRITFYNLRRSVVINSTTIDKIVLQQCQDLFELCKQKLKNNELDSEDATKPHILLFEELSKFVPLDIVMKQERQNLINLPNNEIIAAVEAKTTKILDDFFANINKTNDESEEKTKFIKILKAITLHVLDDSWKEHLHSVDSIRSSVSLRSYAQKDPLNEYKIEAYGSFEQMIYRFKHLSLFSILMYILEQMAF